MSRRQRGFSTLAVVLVVAAVAGASTAGWFVWQQNKAKQATTTAPVPENKPAENNQAPGFANPKKGAHFETSTPAHGTTLAAVPADIVIDFNFDLATNSTIKIEKDGKDYGVGDTKVDTNKLAMRRQMDKNAPEGIYTVNYNGCWPDKTCHDGRFQFAINKGLLNTYEDMRNQQTVTIKMSDIKFKPMNLRISSGTKVTWVNDDDAEHYVNTDSHPAHTHVPGLNSKSLVKGATYSFTFQEKGSYPYHCSAHAADMVGNIVVE